MLPLSFIGGISPTTFSSSHTTNWLDPNLDNRHRFSVKNTSATDLHDHVVTYAMPGAVAPDSASLRVVENNALWQFDRGFDYRYGPSASNDLNHMIFLPAYTSAGNLIFKSLGRWPAGETRYFTIYWQTTPTYSAISNSHLSALAWPWSVGITRGSTGDVYSIVVGGVTYSYTQLAGDTTATLVATGLSNLINAGVVATSNVVSGTPADCRVYSLTPLSGVNGGDFQGASWITKGGTTTTPGNITLLQAPAFGIGRIGPDTASFPLPTTTNQNYNFGMGTAFFPASGQQSAAISAGQLGFGRATLSVLLRQFKYTVSGDATNYFATSGLITSITNNGPTITVTGTLVGNTGTHGQYWSGTYTATYTHKLVAGIKTDNTNYPNLQKYVDQIRLVITLTSNTTYTPPTVATGNNSSTLQIAAMCNLSNFSGNATVLSPNNLTNYYSNNGGAITSFAASADLHSLPVPGTVIGSAGNTNASGIVVNSVTLSNWGSRYNPNGSNPAVVQFFANGNPFVFLQINNLTTAATIPAGATIVADLTMAEGYTQSATTVGDSLTPSELVAILQNAYNENAGSPPVTSAAVATETYAQYSLPLSLLNATEAAYTGIKFKINNANTLLGAYNNYTWAYSYHNGLFSYPDDLDGTLGEGFALSGLCLRYLRTWDTSILPYIELQARYFIDLEKDTVNWYGAWWVGSVSYFWNAFSWTSAIEGGFQQPGSSGSQMDPNASSYTASVSDPSTLSLGGLSGGTYIGVYNPATTYHNKDWVTYTDTGGTYSGVAFWVQWTGGTSGATAAPTNSSGNVQSSWATKSDVQYTMNYVLNQPRASTSNDQVVAMGIGLYHYLYLLRNDPALTSATPPTWRVGDITRGSTGNNYVLVIGGVTVSYTQQGSDTNAVILAASIATAVNASAAVKALGVVATAVPSGAASPTIGALYLTGMTGLTLTNTGTTTPANMPVNTLRSEVISYLGRAATFQSAALPGNTGGVAKTSANLCMVPQLYNLVTGTTTYTNYQNGITLQSGTYYSNYATGSTLSFDSYNGGSQAAQGGFGLWQLTQTNGSVISSDSNAGLADLFRTLVALTGPGGVSADRTGIVAYILGRMSDTMSLDIGYHAWTYGSTLTTYGTTGNAYYPPGWNLRSGNTANLGYLQTVTPATTYGTYGTAGTNDTHYFNMNSTGGRDNMNGRAFQRMALLCFLGMYASTTTAPYEMDSTASPNAAIVRSINVATYVDSLAATLCSYLFDPNTNMVRFGSVGAMGNATTTLNTTYVHTTFSAYAIFALEAYQLMQQVLQGNSDFLPLYYKYSAS